MYIPIRARGAAALWFAFFQHKGHLLSHFRDQPPAKATDALSKRTAIPLSDGASQSRDGSSTTKAGPMDDMLQVSREDRGGLPVVRVAGEGDVSTSPALRAELEAIPETNARVIVDLSQVTFLDSTGIGVLIAAMKRFRDSEASGTLQLVVTKPHILKVLEITGLTPIFDIHGSLEEIFDR